MVDPSSSASRSDMPDGHDGPAAGPAPVPTSSRTALLPLFWVFLRLGLTSFGGPVAHLGYFRETFVIRKQWLDDAAYADLVALCQLLPGPASSQVGLAIGYLRGGLAGSLLAWAGFTLPSALFLALFALSVTTLDPNLDTGWLLGLKCVAVAIVAHAVIGMMRTLAPDAPRASMAMLAAAFLLLFPSALAQVLVLTGGALAGLLLARVLPGSISPKPTHAPPFPRMVSKRLGLLLIGLFGLLLIGLPILANFMPVLWLEMTSAFYRAGALVFGGGHVVLPVLQADMAAKGWTEAPAFMAGYGMAQAVPGPLFTFSAYLGTLINGWSGAMIALIAIFLPSFLLVLGALPFWQILREQPRAQHALRGLNAAVVGLLIAAFYDPVWTAAILGPAHFALALLAYLQIAHLRWPAWLVVFLSAGIGQGMALLGLFA